MANSRDPGNSKNSPEADLPPAVRQFFLEFVESAKTAAGENLTSIILFGSGAEGRLRSTSDLNLMCVLRNVDSAALDGFRKSIQSGRAFRLRVMFIRADELPEHAKLFSVKFQDLKRRHLVLYGPDPLESLEIDRAALAARARQILANLKLRSRAAYAADGDNAARLTLAVADMAGPLRSAAAAVRSLQGSEMEPKAALAAAAEQAGITAAVLENVSRAREEGKLTLEAARTTMQALGGLCDYLLAGMKGL